MKGTSQLPKDKGRTTSEFRTAGEISFTRLTKNTEAARDEAWKVTS